MYFKTIINDNLILFKIYLIPNLKIKIAGKSEWHFDRALAITKFNVRVTN